MNHMKEICEKENIKFDFLDEEIVDEIIKLGIAEYQRIQVLGGI